MSVLDLERWNATSPYLDQALDLSEEERNSLLDEIDQQDPSLAADLRALLDTHRALLEEKFLETSPAPLHDLLISAGQTLGSYTLIAPIGQGGMGTVWLAERNDGRFERKVAIKLLSMGLRGRTAGRRFLREGVFLAQLVHPNIAQLLDAGVTPSGQPYLVLEHVDGEQIDTYCDRRAIPVEGRIRLFLAVAAAVVHAHSHLIVHRDLKPANVLVTTAGDVKLLDFGIARMLADDNQPMAATMLTRDGRAALTPEFAAPEQMTGAVVTTATDVYALGVLLYLLLSGQHPAGSDAQSHAGLVRAIVETVPPSISDAVAANAAGAQDLPRIAAARATSPERLRRQLLGDLDTIVNKALKKDPAERYAGVGALADDLLRYLRHEPIGARPDSLAYRARKFVRRNRAIVGVASFAVLATIAGVAATMMQSQLAKAQRDFALRQLARAEAVNDLNQFLLSDAAPSGKPFTVNELLARAERIVTRQHSVDEAVRAELLTSIGRQYGAQDEVAAALRVLEQARSIADSTSEPSTHAQVACALANELAASGEAQRAQHLIREGLNELPGDSRYELDRAFCLLRGSRVARELGAADEAIAQVQDAQRALARAPFRSEVLDLRAAMDLAESFSQAGRFGEANNAFEQAAQILRQLGRDDTATAGTLFNNWALSLNFMGRPHEAEPLYRRAIDISRADTTDEAVSPMLLINYARVLRDLGRPEQAADYAENGYEKGRASGHEVGVNQALLLRASIYRDLGELERAAVMLDEVEPRLAAALPPGHVAFASLASERAQLAQAQGDLPLALDLIEQAMAIAEADRRAGGAADIVPRLQIRRAELFIALDRPAEAVTAASSALEFFLGSAANEHTSFAGMAYLELARAQQKLGNAGDASAAFAAATAHLESALGPDHSKSRQARQHVLGDLY